MTDCTCKLCRRHSVATDRVWISLFDLSSFSLIFEHLGEEARVNWDRDMSWLDMTDESFEIEITLRERDIRAMSPHAARIYELSSGFCVAALVYESKRWIRRRVIRRDRFIWHDEPLDDFKRRSE